MSKKVNLNQLMQDIVYISNQQAGLKMLLDQKKAIVAKYFQQTGEKQLSNDEATLFVQERTDIKYDIPAILKRLPKKLTSQFISRTYTIPDWPAFAAWLKLHDLSPDEVKSFISVEKQVDQARLSKLYEKGYISLSDLDGCYEATNRQSVCLRMKNVDQEIHISRGKDE